MIVLRGRVARIESASNYIDRIQRIDIKPTAKDEYWSVGNVKNTMGAQLDQEVEVLLQPIALPEEVANRELAQVAAERREERARQEQGAPVENFTLDRGRGR